MLIMKRHFGPTPRTAPASRGGAIWCQHDEEDEFDPEDDMLDALNGLDMGADPQPDASTVQQPEPFV